MGKRMRAQVPSFMLPLDNRVSLASSVGWLAGVLYAVSFFFDASKGRIYILGEGFIEAWQQKDADHYERIDRYSTPSDGRTGLFVPDLGELFETIPHHGQQSAEILVYNTK